MLLLKLMSMLVVLACTRRRVVAQPDVLLMTMGMLRLQTNPPRPSGLRLEEMRLVEIIALWTMNRLMFVLIMAEQNRRACRGESVLVMAMLVV